MRLEPLILVVALIAVLAWTGWVIFEAEDNSPRAQCEREHGTQCQVVWEPKSNEVGE